MKELKQVLQNVRDLPPEPTMACKIMKMAQDPDYSVNILAETISHDPAASAKLLRIANSVYYNVQGTVSTLDRAIVILGQNTVRSLVFDICLRGLRTKFNLLQRRVWEESMVGAIGARMIAQSIETADPDEAFIAALFRHVGKIVMVNMDTEKYKKVLTITEKGEKPLLEAEREMFGFSHDILGAAVLHRWDFPMPLVQSILHHHDLAINSEKSPDLHNLAATVNLAGGLCCRRGIGRRSPGEDCSLEHNAGARALSLSIEQLEQIWALFIGCYLDERDFFLP